jgi:DNA invertase Pin-like site-specific DNA recombinase
MTAKAYLRVSTNEQDVSNQKHGVLEYANEKKLHIDHFVEDSVSGRKPWKDRKIGELIETLKQGDVVLVSEISRMARSLLQILEMIQAIAEAGATIHIIKNGLIIGEGGKPQDKIMVAIMGMVAEMERDLIALRTKEALAARKKDGMILGRPKGKASNLKLDEKRQQIQDLLDKGVNKRSIAKIVNCSPATLYSYMKRKRMTPRVAA